LTAGLITGDCWIVIKDGKNVYLMQENGWHLPEPIALV
jgi:hypothetical protein